MRFQWQTVVSSSLNVTDKLGAIWTDTRTDSAECGTHLLLLLDNRNRTQKWDESPC